MAVRNFTQHLIISKRTTASTVATTVGTYTSHPLRYAEFTISRVPAYIEYNADATVNSTLWRPGDGPHCTPDGVLIKSISVKPYSAKKCIIHGVGWR